MQTSCCEIIYNLAETDTCCDCTCKLMVDVVWTESVAAITVKTKTNLKTRANVNNTNWLAMTILSSKRITTKWIHCNLRKHNLKAQTPANGDASSWIQLIGCPSSCLEAFWVHSFQYDRCYSCPRTLQHDQLCMSAQVNRNIGWDLHDKSNRNLLLTWVSLVRLHDIL